MSTSPRKPIRVTVWNEHIHEQRDPAVRGVYPHGIHHELAEALRELHGALVDVRTATLDDPGHGLGDELLGSTDVLVWWAHVGHELVPDGGAARVQDSSRSIESPPGWFDE